MQGIELRHVLVIETDHLAIKDGSALDARGLLDDARVAVSPIGPVHRIEPHPPIADVDLQPSRGPAGAAWRQLDDMGG